MTRIAQKAKSVSASIPTIRRLPAYLEFVKNHRREEYLIVFSRIIASALELESIQVRKDIGVTGTVGNPHMGYPPENSSKLLRAS